MSLHVLNEVAKSIFFTRIVDCIYGPQLIHEKQENIKQNSVLFFVFNPSPASECRISTALVGRSCSNSGLLLVGLLRCSISTSRHSVVSQLTLLSLSPSRCP